MFYRIMVHHITVYSSILQYINVGVWLQSLDLHILFIAPEYDYSIPQRPILIAKAPI